MQTSSSNLIIPYFLYSISRYSNSCVPLVKNKTIILHDSILVLCRVNKSIIYKNVHHFIQPNSVGKKGDEIFEESILIKNKFKLNVTKVSFIPRTTIINSSSIQSSLNNIDDIDKNGSNDNKKENDQNKNKNENEEKLSVIIFGTDSVSRLNFRRHLPQTFEFLTKELGAYEFLGFNKVADNTFPNLMPILMGLSDEELANHTCLPRMREKFDDCPIIWKDFKAKGYITSFIEVRIFYCFFILN